MTTKSEPERWTIGMANDAYSPTGVWIDGEGPDKIALAMSPRHAAAIVRDHNAGPEVAEALKALASYLDGLLITTTPLKMGDNRTITFDQSVTLTGGIDRAFAALRQAGL